MTLNPKVIREHWREYKNCYKFLNTYIHINFPSLTFIFLSFVPLSLEEMFYVHVEAVKFHKVLRAKNE